MPQPPLVPNGYHVMNSVSQRIAEELLVHERQVTAAIELLDDGATVPLSRATEKKSPMALMTRNFVTLKTVSDIYEN